MHFILPNNTVWASKIATSLASEKGDYRWVIYNLLAKRPGIATKNLRGILRPTLLIGSVNAILHIVQYYSVESSLLNRIRRVVAALTMELQFLQL